MIKQTWPDQALIKMPSLRAVKAFLAVARWQNFTRAAEERSAWRRRNPSMAFATARYRTSATSAARRSRSIWTGTDGLLIMIST